jgi:UDP-GlcNAc:undecaprenyl-phosphate GlcNAc-1-phosphate transferase
MNEPLVSYGLGFAVTVMVVGLLRPVAARIGLVDQPGARKAHVDGVPVIGGLAIFCGFTLAALTLDQTFTPYRSFFAASAVLVVIGVLDDMRELTSRARFGAQILAAGLMAWWGGIFLEDLGGLRGAEAVFELGAWAIPFTIFATVGVINALNMVDGIDGLAGGLSLIALLGLAYIANDAGLADRRDLLLLLAACLIAFVMFNARLPGRPRALVFLGDAGSMFLGFAITWFFIDMSQGPVRAMTPVTALWLLLIPLFDTVWLLIKRPLTGQWPTTADAEHIHHVVQMIGLEVNQAVGLLLGIGSACAVLGIVAMKLGVPQNLMFWIFILLFAAYCLLMAIAWSRKRLFGHPMDRRLDDKDRRSGKQRRVGDRRSGVDRRRQSERRAVLEARGANSESAVEDESDC